MLRDCANPSCARRFRGDGPSTPLFSGSRNASFDRTLSLCDRCLSFLVMCGDDFAPHQRPVARPFSTSNKDGAVDRRWLDQPATERSFRIRTPAVA